MTLQTNYHTAHQQSQMKHNGGDAGTLSFPQGEHPHLDFESRWGQTGYPP